MSLSDAFIADSDGRFVEAGERYWQAFESGEAFDTRSTLRALFIFFDSTDPGVGPGNGLSHDDMEVARQRFRQMLGQLRALGLDDDAEVWRNWIGQLGMDSLHELPESALKLFADKGSREAAWRLAADGDLSPQVVNLASSLKIELSYETTFRAAYVLHMLRNLPVT